MVKKNQKISKDKRKRFVASIILTTLFLSTFVLGLIPLYPFGTYVEVGDIVTSKFTSVVIIPIFPLVITYNLLDTLKTNIFEKYLPITLIIMFVIVVCYYYLLSRIIVYFYLKAIGVNKDKKSAWANAVLVFFVLLFSFAVVSADSYSDLFNNGLIVQANVTDTKELRINFVPVDYSSLFSLMFVSAANNNSAFINATYPLAEGKYVPTFSSEMNFSSNIEELTLFNQCSLLKRIYRFGRVSGSDYDRVVGIVPNNWFAEHGDPIGAGYSCGGLFGNIKAILIEDYFRHGAAHEVGHTLGDVGGVLRKIGLCDEYNSDVWENQDSILDRCPNGDSNPDNGELFVH